MEKADYKILWDYNTEGLKFEDGSFASVAQAVKYAMSQGFSATFLIVQVIEWEANPLP